MADAAHTTSCRMPAPAFTHTPISATFSRLLGAMAVHIGDIQHVDVWDPAFRGWLTDAEEALTAVTTLLCEIRDHQTARQADVPLMRMAIIADAMLGAEEPGEFIVAQRLLARRHLFSCRTGGAVGRRIHAMIETAYSRLRDLAELEAYAPDRERFMPAEPDSAFAA
ncbi:hypothetical protein SAMN04244548_04932 [Paracoccus pantotrophus]|nr:hypothetical protein SAMN04244548_04932 [Paracoccus pantotrophus]